MYLALLTSTKGKTVEQGRRPFSLSGHEKHKVSITYSMKITYLPYRRKKRQQLFYDYDLCYKDNSLYILFTAIG